jgi:hypothetical protein
MNWNELKCKLKLRNVRDWKYSGSKHIRMHEAQLHGDWSGYNEGESVSAQKDCDDSRRDLIGESEDPEKYARDINESNGSFCWGRVDI